MEENNNQSQNHQPEMSNSGFSDHSSSPEVVSDGFNNEAPRGRRGVRSVVYIVIILALIFGAFWFLGSSPKDDMVDSSDGNNTEDITPANSDSDSDNDIDSNIGPAAPSAPSGPSVSNSSSLVIFNQSAGDSVEIDRVVLEQAGWVSISEDLNGERGNILGALWLPAGTHTGQQVELLRGTEPGRKYYGVIRSDDGDLNHGFDKDINLEVKDSDGNFLITTFQTIAGE